MKQQNNTEWKEVEFGNAEYFEVKKGESITKDKVTEGKIPVVAGRPGGPCLGVSQYQEVGLYGVTGRLRGSPGGQAQEESEK